MQENNPGDKALQVREMFSAIAGRYDLMNAVMSGGMDRLWRRRLMGLCRLPEGGRLLDLGAGTGDLAREALRRQPSLRVTAGDLTLEMMRRGKERKGGGSIRWACVDALQLPFEEHTFDVVVSGYLMRNVSDVGRAWREQLRVLKPGGTSLCLDTTPLRRDAAPLRRDTAPLRRDDAPLKRDATPLRSNVLHLPVHFYLKWIVPLLGSLLTGNKVAYTYLPESTEHFLTAEELGARMGEAGFQGVRFQRMAFDTMAFHMGFKEK